MLCSVLMRFLLFKTRYFINHCIVEEGNNYRSGTYPLKLFKNSLSHLRFRKTIEQMINNYCTEIIIIKPSLENVYDLEVICIINAVFAK